MDDVHNYQAKLNVLVQSQKNYFASFFFGYTLIFYTSTISVNLFFVIDFWPIYGNENF